MDILKLNSRIAKSEKLPWRIIEQQAILVDVERGNIIQLNEVAAFIWGGINGERTVGEIIKSVYEIFEIDKDEAEKDGLEFLGELLKKRLIALK